MLIWVDEAQKRLVFFRVAGLRLLLRKNFIRPLGMTACILARGIWWRACAHAQASPGCREKAKVCALVHAIMPYPRLRDDVFL